MNNIKNRLMKSMPSHPISLISILILFSHPCLCLPSGLLPSITLALLGFYIYFTWSDFVVAQC
jgi:hypothetical protein